MTKGETLVTTKNLTKAVQNFKGDYYGEDLRGEYHVFQKLVDFPDQTLVVPGVDGELKYDSIIQGKMDFAAGVQKQQLRFTVGGQLFSIERAATEDDVEEYCLGTLAEVTQS